MIQKELPQGVVSSKKRHWVDAIISEFVKGQVEILQPRPHVAKHIAWNSFNLISYKYQME